MDNRVVHVPIALLLDRDRTTTAKVVWMALRLHRTAGPAELEARTGLSRPTVLRGLREVSGWKHLPDGPRVRVPGALVADRTVGAQAKVLYGLLQVAPTFRRQGGAFTYASLCALTQLGRNTLKRAVADLVGARWIQATQENRLSPIRFTLGNPELVGGLAEARMARRRLKRAKFAGEAIMYEYLSLLVDSDQFTDGARPGFLINPESGHRMELDRFYPPNVAFEFHGAQHDGATDRFTQAEVEEQQKRDLIKAGICLYRGMQLIIIRAEDLTLQGMIRKIGQSLPLRPLAGHEPLIDLLEEASLRYRVSAEAGRRREQDGPGEGAGAGSA